MSPENMNSIEQNLTRWKNSLLLEIPVASLLSRNPIAYKWKALMRSWMLREASFWRMHDLMEQSYSLYLQGHMLGARILLRSGLETLATLIYLNQQTRQVLKGKLNFHIWGEKSGILLLGSRNNEVLPMAINIITVLKECDKLYPGIMSLYSALSESAHPNYDGVFKGYSKINHGEYEVTFSNRWEERYGERHLSLMELCMGTFHDEYNDVWTELTEKLESWIEDNNEDLEASKGDNA